MVLCAEVFQGKLWLWVSGWHGPNLQFWNNCKTFPKYAKCICTADVWVLFLLIQLASKRGKGHLLSLRYLGVLVNVLCWGHWKGCRATGWPSWPLITLQYCPQHFARLRASWSANPKTKRSTKERKPNQYGLRPALEWQGAFQQVLKGQN